MKFDYEGARKAGYSDAEIAQYIASESGFDLDGALGAGYSPSEVLSFLTTGDEPQERPGILARVAKGLGLGGREYDENEMGGQMITPDESRRNAAEYGKRERAAFEKDVAIPAIRAEALRMRGIDNPEDQAALANEAIPEDEMNAARKRLGDSIYDRDLPTMVSDTATAIGSGVKQLASAPVQLVSPDGETARRMRAEIDETNAALSPQMQGQLELFSQNIKDAAEEGRWAEVQAAFSGLSPALVAHFTANTLPSMLPVLGAGKVVQIAAIARGATPAGVMLAGARGAGAANAVLNAGSVRGDAFQDLERVFIEQGMSPEEAKETALSESWLPTAVAAVTGYAGGRFGAESDIIGGAVAQAARGGVLPALKAAVGSLGRELGTEQLEELLPQMTANLLAGRDALDGLAETAAQTVAGAAGPGTLGAASAAQRAYDPLGSELQGLPGEVERTQFSDADLARAQAQQAMDASAIMAKIGSAQSVDEAIAAASEAMAAPNTNLQETMNVAAQVAQGRAQEQGDLGAGGLGNNLDLRGLDGRGGADAGAPALGDRAGGVVGNAGLADPSLINQQNDLDNLENDLFGVTDAAQAQPLAQEATQANGQETGSQQTTAPASIRVADIIAGTNAAQGVVGNGQQPRSTGPRVLDVSELPVADDGRGDIISRAEGEAVRDLAAAFGGQADIVLPGTESLQWDGVTWGNTNRISINARSKNAVAVTVAHEVGHVIENQGNEAWAAFESVVLDEAKHDLRTDEGLLKYAMDYAPSIFSSKEIHARRSRGESSTQILDALIPKIGAGYDRAAVRKEFAKDVFGNAMMSDGFMGRVASKLSKMDVPLLKTVIDTLTKAINVLRGNKNRSSFRVDQMIKNLERVRDAAATVAAKQIALSDNMAKRTVPELLMIAKRNPDADRRDAAQAELKRRETEQAYKDRDAQNEVSESVRKQQVLAGKRDEEFAQRGALEDQPQVGGQLAQAFGGATLDRQAQRRSAEKDAKRLAAGARQEAQARAGVLGDNEEGRYSMGRETAGDHKMEITREERELADKTKLTREELSRVSKYAKQFGLPSKMVEMEVRRIKARFPEAAGWAPLTLLRVDPKTMSKKAKENNPLPSDAIFFEPYGYQFHLDPSGKDAKATHEKRVNDIAAKLAGEILAKYMAYQQGDKNAEVVMRQADWYQALRGKLRATFGGFGDFLAQLLGPTSANNPVEPNFKYAVEALKMATSGEWDNLFKEVFAWKADIDAAAANLDGVIEKVRAEGGKGVMKDPRVLEAVKALKAASKYKGTLPRRENGKMFGMASEQIVQILGEQWGDKVWKDAPKTKNYYQNIMGRTFDATIDVWAARTLRRLANDVVGDLPRIPPVAETAVAGNVLADGVTSGSEFGFGQEVFRKAAEDLRKSGIPQFANSTPDAIQAMAWFIEKETWATRNWTTKVGEEGSIEHEMLLAGYADRAQVDAWRVAARAGKPNPETKKYLRKNGEFNQAKYEKDVAEWEKAKEIGKEMLKKIESYPDRFVAGATMEIPNDRPTNSDMAGLAREIEKAAADPEKVMAARAQTSTGEFMGDFERTLDVEVVARNGYDAMPLWNKLVEIGQREGQEAVFLSRVLREGETVDPTFHRPGVELYFAKPITLEQAKPLMDLINESGVHGMTMVTEGRRTPSAMAGEEQGIVGIRMQHIPEFMLGYGYNVGATDAEIVSSIEAALGKMDDLVAELKKRQETSTVTRHWYETRVHKYGNATGISGEGPRTGDREVWSGQRISEGLQGADRFARDGQAPLAARRAELLKERAVSRSRSDKAGGNRSAKYSPSRSGAGNESGTGSLRAPAYGTGQQGSVSLTGVHYSKAERSSLAGHYYGQGMKGAEGQRLNRESATKEQRRRVHFYVDEGSGIRPESDVGDHAHQTQLDNLYDVNGDPLNLWDEARDAYKDPVDRFNKMEQLVMERGFDGVYVSEAQGSQGVAVLLGSKHVAVPAQYIGTGYRGGDAKPQAAKPKAQTNADADKVASARALPLGQMTGADWKRIVPLVVPDVDVSMLDDAKTYYKDDVVSAMRASQVRMSPSRAAPSRDVINQAVDDDFTGIVARMKKAGVLTVECS